MTKGYHCLMLHAHLPFVRHPEQENYLEERWLYEAMTETYIPLLRTMKNLEKDNVPFKLTISLSPPLLTMLADPLLQSRYLKYLRNLQQLAAKEVARTKNDGHLSMLANMYQDIFIETEKFFLAYDKNIINAFKEFQDKNMIELMTCGATHTFLPLIQAFPEAVKVQASLAVDTHRQHLGTEPQGIWLPECGYYVGLDHILAECGLKYFFCDTHGVLYADPQPKYGSYAPLVSPSGLVAFPRDYESSKQVWSAQEGFPGDVDYREYYRDIGYDLDMEYIGPHLPIANLRGNTGIKYHRITGRSEYKEWYNPYWAREKAATHAGNFMFNREKQIEYSSKHMDIPPIVVSPYDAELFGHWWFEGPQFLEYYLRKVAYDQDIYKMTTPSEYLSLGLKLQHAQPSTSSWGNEGYNQVWLDDSNSWIYQHLHHFNREIINLVAAYNAPDKLSERALNQAIRELLLAQSSDWAFIMKTGTMVEYAHKRTKNHLAWTRRLLEQLANKGIDEEFLEGLENTNNIFPQLHYKVYCQ
ncbi:MAG: 1,4-alpha-glucan branching protein domain-containing protein [Bacillota bacterium]|nr:1,4-alpha-glucan branching protein domain-containing protein [Bacillota bacterium]